MDGSIDRYTPFIATSNNYKAIGLSGASDCFYSGNQETSPRQKRMESKHDIFQFWEVPSIARVSQWGIPAKWHFWRGRMLISDQIWDDIPKSSIKQTQSFQTQAAILLRAYWSNMSNRCGSCLLYGLPYWACLESNGHNKSIVSYPPNQHHFTAAAARSQVGNTSSTHAGNRNGVRYDASWKSLPLSLIIPAVSQDARKAWRWSFLVSTTWALHT